jgi:hypothetical protein
VTVLAFGSVKGAPGVSTSVLALGCVWPRPVLLIEADPAGGLLLSGLGRDCPAAAGLLTAALQSRRGHLDLLSHTVALTADDRIRLLPGLTDPAHTAVVSDQSAGLAHAISGFAGTDEWDVLIDAGRLQAGSPWPLLAIADAIALLIRPRVQDVALLHGWLPVLRDRLAGVTQTLPQLGAISVGNRPYGARELTDALVAPLVGALADDTLSAQRLMAGDRRLSGRSALLRSVSGLVPNLERLAAGTDAAWLTPTGREMLTRGATAAAR